MGNLTTHINNQVKLHLLTGYAHGFCIFCLVTPLLLLLFLSCVSKAYPIPRNLVQNDNKNKDVDDAVRIPMEQNDQEMEDINENESENDNNETQLQIRDRIPQDLFDCDNNVQKSEDESLTDNVGEFVPGVTDAQVHEQCNGTTNNMTNIEGTVDRLNSDDDDSMLNLLL